MSLPLIVAGCIFAALALFHLIRLYIKFEIRIGRFTVPVRASIVGALGSLLLSVWMFSVL